MATRRQRAIFSTTGATSKGYATPHPATQHPLTVRAAPTPKAPSSGPHPVWRAGHAVSAAKRVSVKH